MKGGREGEREPMRKGGREGWKRGDLRLSGDLTRVAEEEDRRLLMPASDGCFRFMVDVERLSTEGERRRDRQGRRDLHLRSANGGRDLGGHRGVHVSARS